MSKTTGVKDRIVAELRAGPRTKAALLGMFPDQNQARGAAGVLAFMVRSDEAEIVDDCYVLTGRPPKKVERPAKPSKARPDPWQLSTQGAVADPEECAAEDVPPVPPLEWALWHDGDLLIRRGDASIVLTEGERERLSVWLGRVAA